MSLYSVVCVFAIITRQKSCKYSDRNQTNDMKVSLVIIYWRKHSYVGYHIAHLDFLLLTICVQGGVCEIMYIDIHTTTTTKSKKKIKSLAIQRLNLPANFFFFFCRSAEIFYFCWRKRNNTMKFKNKTAKKKDVELIFFLTNI